MDVFVHALTGAATGAIFGRPVLGAVVAALPDVVLGVRRRAYPSAAYNATHSAAFVLLAALVATLLHSPAVGSLVALCLLSHLVLDIPTHGDRWAPPLLYPFTATRYSAGYEWEFFNHSWQQGFALALLWILTCLLFV